MDAVGTDRDMRGVVSVEFLLAFVPLFVLFLGAVQLALLEVAAMVVQHAAVAGVRAAVVVLSDESRFYGRLECGRIDGAKGRTQERSTSDFAQRLGVSPAPADGDADAREGARMAAIRSAVHAPLASIAPEPWTAERWLSPQTRPTVATALGHDPLARLAFGLGVYLPITTAITFPISPGSRALHSQRVP